MGLIRTTLRKTFGKISPFPSYCEYDFFIKKKKALARNGNAMNFSFSQEGEDLILETMFYKFFGKTNEGFFVDLGAYNPLKYSNTMKFYVKGWRGVNIDARPGSMKEFNKLRPEDTNVEAAISPDGKQAVYYEFSEPTANTFDSRAAEESLKLGLTMTGKHVLDTYTVNELFDKYIPEGQKIDLLDIDVEGFDSMIVQQLDWDKYHPSIVMIETSVDSENIIPKIMKKNGYVLRGRTYFNDIYILK
jgi:hypothetical protein